ncbi:uncharacterized protein LOC143809698 [Ranitomeya variabilis]|uniref:uncharacterized protein LOC143809698 n=1 Tax=Ranitomeya variabilis TaxID=490064 RepID=UPI0040574487
MEDVVKALVQSTAVQQQATAAQHEANRLMSAQLKELMDMTVADRQLLQQVAQRLVSMPEADPEAESRRIHVSRYWQKLTAEDDVEAYLTTFERTALREKWPKARWADLIAPFLSGEAQKAYHDLDPEVAQDFEKLKVEILARLGVTTAVRAQRVHQWTYQQDKPARSQMFDLICLTKKWLQPEVLTTPEIIQRIVLDKYLRVLPPGLKKWVSQGNPTTADQLVELVERYSVTEGLPDKTASTRSVPSPRGTGKTVPATTGEGKLSKTVGKEHGTARTPRPRGLDGGLSRGPVRCFRCREKGHISANCPVTTEPMQCDVTDSKKCMSLVTRLVNVNAGQNDIAKHLCELSVDGKSIVALLDSGSVVTLVKASLVALPSGSSDKFSVTCVHGDTCSYLTAVISISTPYGSVQHKVGLVPALLQDVILGRDFPHFWQLWENQLLLHGSCESFPMPSGGPELLEEDPQEDVAGEVIETNLQFPCSVLAGETEETEETEETQREADSHPAPGLPDLGVQLDDFHSEQMKDSTLIPARKNVKMIDGVPVEPDTRLAYPYMVLENDLLYQVEKKGEDTVQQLVVPKPYRRKVLDLAHGHIMGGHLGVQKTTERISHCFVWPGIHSDVRNYCESCPECQISAPKTRFCSPLVPLPIIGVPFERIGMDLVGPLPRSARGHQHILVIMDYATRYPEAVPLRNTATKTIAKELVQVFSRVGIPKQILTDQGTPFMSRVMKELCRLLQIDQLRTSVYHPQTDGLVERFNKTLKQMLRKAIDKDGKNWDYLLPYLLFAIREVPQSSTGFSPFELLYARRPRGLLDVTKETWEGQVTPFKTVIDHVTQMQDRIAAVMPIVRDHMLQAQGAQRQSYDRGAKVRTFASGDRVLVLIPTVDSKFLAKWQGPFEVMERVGEVNYKVYQPGKRKPEQIYHVNLIKPWKDRSALTADLPRPVCAPTVP